MDKKFWISTAAVFVVWMIGSFLLHGYMLNGYYSEMPNIMRTMDEQEGLMHFMLLAHILMSAAFVWIYQRGNEDKPWLQQGFRFGIAIALFAPIPTFMIYYTVQQTPAGLAVGQAVGDSLVVIVVALVAAFLNRKTA